MTIITPRTCLWPLVTTLILTFALSIGMTFISNHHCFAGTCGESLFPLQARIHVVVWYSWLVLSIGFLAIRASNPVTRNLLQSPIFKRRIPFLGKHLAWGGAFILVWILMLYGILIGIWWVHLRDYFIQRGHEGGVYRGNGRLAAIALTGHLCDVSVGMALMPISRHSALASFFKLSVASTLTFHMLTAYTLFALVVAHTLLYVAWIPVFYRLSETLRQVYPVLNPTFLFHETWPGNRLALGKWRASLIFTGIVSTFIMLLIFITTLQPIRNRHFNLFYFTHLLGVVAVVVICLHASTMLYCTAPGLAMWVLDWAMRLYELWAPLDGNITALGKGWYRLSASLPRRRLQDFTSSSPLVHFYIHNSNTSARELHPFTTTTHLASQNTIISSREDTITIEFLFRKTGANALARIPTKPSPNFTLLPPGLYSHLHRIFNPQPRAEWTHRLASLAGEEIVNTNASASTPTDIALASSQITSQDSFTSTEGSQLDLESLGISFSGVRPSKEVALKLRLEGPYFAAAKPARYRTVICLVAGTGVSGALAIVSYFKEMERQRASMEASEREDAAQNAQNRDGNWECSNERNVSKQKPIIWKRCVVVWSVREDQFISLKELQTSAASNLEVRVHLTGKESHRLDAGKCLDEIMQGHRSSEDNEGGMADTWVYISGPNKFIEVGESACKSRRASGRAVDWYGAKWHV